MSDLYPDLAVTTANGTTLRVGSQFRLAHGHDRTAFPAFSDMVVVGFRTEPRGTFARLVRPHPTVVLNAAGNHDVFFGVETLNLVNVEDLANGWGGGAWVRLDTDRAEPLVHVLTTVTRHDALSDAAIAAAAVLVADGDTAALLVGRTLGELAPSPLASPWTRPLADAEALVDSADLPFLRRVLAALPWQWAYRAAAALVATSQVRGSAVPARRD